MRKRLFTAITLLFILLIYPGGVFASTGTGPLVQVELRNFLGNQTDITITVNGNYRVVGADIVLIPNQTYRVLKNSSAHLQLFHGDTHISTFTSPFTIEPEIYNHDHFVAINNVRRYLGSMRFTVQTIQDNQFVRPINILPLEDYLKGVVPFEMPALWHLEALKVQAIAARTYAIRRINSILNDTQGNQVYGGFSWHPNSTAAVDLTRGEVVRMGNAFAETVYSSSNGGMTESNSCAWRSTQLPYLPAQVDGFDPQHTWSFPVRQQQIQPPDLYNPSAWWNNTNEDNLNLSNLIKQELYRLSAYQSAQGLKIQSINSISFTDRTSGHRFRTANFIVSFFVRDNLRNNFLVHELQGETRWDTAIAISQLGWKEPHNVAIIARGDQAADALTGNVLAAKYNAPILLTRNDMLPPQTAEELIRLNPAKVYILGGPNAVNLATEQEIKRILQSSTTVIRLYGDDRFGTSIAIAKEVNSPSGSIILAPAFDNRGNESPDPLTIGPYAGINQIPIILSARGQLSPEISQYIQDNSINKAYIIGGKSVITSEVETQVGILVSPDNVERIAGDTRFGTAIAIADRFSLNNQKVFIARGDGHADVLAAAPLATLKQAPIILTNTASVPSESFSWINREREKIEEVYFLGGPLAIASGTRGTILDAPFRMNTDGTLRLFTEQVSFSTDHLRSAIGTMTMRSTLIDSDTVTSNNGVYTITGRGFGHGVGMSQWGAQARAIAGHTYQQILQFYYPGTSIKKEDYFIQP